LIKNKPLKAEFTSLINIYILMQLPKINNINCYTCFYFYWDSFTCFI